VVRQHFGLPDQRVCLLELDVDSLLSLAPEVRYYRPVSRFPALTRDIALVVDDNVTAAQVREAIQRAGVELLRRVDLFDVYSGEQIPAGKKSLAYTLTYQSDEETLTDEQVNRLQAKLERQLSSELGAELRS
jgi:phenylalanyl-tRNA synthetase beta chain